MIGAALPAWAELTRGQAAFEAGNYADAYLQLVPPARAGNPQAQYLLGRMADNGLGPVALDPREAARWYKRAASRGHADAQFALAQAHALGRGVPQSRKAALQWLERAAEGGHQPALLDLADLYRDGRGVKQDRARAAALLRRAAELGNPDASYSYAQLLAAGDGVEKDEEEASFWFHRAIDLGQPRALYDLGRIAMARLETPAETIIAYKWLTLAMQRGEGDVKRDAERDRAAVAKQMIASDIAAAMERVKDWKPASGPLPGRGPGGATASGGREGRSSRGAAADNRGGRGGSAGRPEAATR